MDSTDPSLLQLDNFKRIVNFVRSFLEYEELNLSYNFVLTEYIWDPFFKYGHLQFHPNVSRSISDTCCFTKNLSSNIAEM